MGSEVIQDYRIHTVSYTARGRNVKPQVFSAAVSHCMGI